MIHTREEIGKVFIRIILVIWFGSEMMLSTTIERFFIWKKAEFNSFMAVTVLALLMVQIVIFQTYNFKELFILAITFVPVVLGAINSGNNNLLSTWLFLMAAKYIDFEDVVKISYIILLVSIPIVIYMFLVGHIPEVTMYRGSIVRHSLGFSHPNWLGMRVFQVVIAYCYVHRRSFNLFSMLVLIVSTYFVYRVPNCQTAYYALIILAIFIALNWFFGLIENGQAFFAKALILAAILSNGLSVIISFVNLNKYPFLRWVDNILSKRLSSCHKVLKYYGLHPFGTKIDLYTIRMNSSVQIFHLDTAYMTILLKYGYWAYIVFSVVFILTMIKCAKKQCYMLVIVLCMYAVYGIMEKSLFVMSQNIFLFAMSTTLFSQNVPHEQIVDSHEVLRFKVQKV